MKRCVMMFAVLLVVQSAACFAIDDAAVIEKADESEEKRLQAVGQRSYLDEQLALIAGPLDGIDQSSLVARIFNHPVPEETDPLRPDYDAALFAILDALSLQNEAQLNRKTGSEYLDSAPAGTDDCVTLQGKGDTEFGDGNNVLAFAYYFQAGVEADRATTFFIAAQQKVAEAQTAIGVADQAFESFLNGGEGGY